MIFMISSKAKFKYKRVKIIWQDIVTNPEWFEDLEPYKMTSIVSNLSV